jgi:amidohydrolase
MPIINSIAAIHPEMTAWRQDLHAHPELSMQESRTAAVVRAKLAEFGVDDIITGMATHGVVGVIRAGSSGRAIGLRADMDALPIHEETGLPHASLTPGVMHACGHDGHTTMLLGAAKYLSATRNFDGTVHLIFQPAEEGRGGAEAMVKDGLFEKFPCEQIFGMHNRPKLDVGKFAIRSGPQMAGGGLFDIKITGKGAHGARPESGIDPVIIATQIISALQSVVSRNVAALDSAVISVTQMHAGDAYNVIPQEAVLRGTIRAFRKETMALVKERIETISKGIAQTLGGKAEADVRIAFPPLVNDRDAVTFIADVAAEIVGPENMNREGPYVMASEDFSYMLEKVPGAFINIGNGGGEGGCEVHNPGYDFNDDIITLGATLWSRVVERKLVKDARFKGAQ